MAYLNSRGIKNRQMSTGVVKDKNLFSGALDYYVDKLKRNRTTSFFFFFFHLVQSLDKLLDSRQRPKINITSHKMFVAVSRSVPRS